MIGKNRFGQKLLSVAMSCFVAAGMMLPAGITGVDTANAADNGSSVFSSAKNYGGKYTDALQHVAYTNDGGFVAGGYTMGDSEDPEWIYHQKGTSHSKNDAVLIKFNEKHEIEWSHAYGDTGVDVFEDMTVLKDGRIAAIGRSPSNGTDQSKLKAVSWWIILVDPSDPLKYTEYRIGGTAGDQGYGISAASDGGFVVAGWSASSEGYCQKSTDGGSTYTDPVQLWQAYDGEKSGVAKRLLEKGAETVVVRFDKDENIKFAAVHEIRAKEHPEAETSPQEKVAGLATDEKDDIIIVGENKYSKYVTNAFIAKLDGRTGELIWHKAAGNDTVTDPKDPAYQHKDVYSAVDVLKDGSYVVTGSTINDATTEEGWDCISQKDILAVHYSADGKCINAESFGVINDSDSRAEMITATSDGGYIVGGSASGVMREDEELDKGYDWGNYGTQDAILVKFSAEDKVSWSKNYGTAAGDWINGLAEGKDGELIVVGESNGKNGTPAWGNNGGVDGIIMCTGEYRNKDAYTEPVNAAYDGAVTWADGSYTASGDGYKGTGSITLTVNIADGRIGSVVNDSFNDTKSYYKKAAVLYDRIVEEQTAEVDTVSGATMSSNGIKQAARNALAMSAAEYVDSLINCIATAEDADAKKAATQTAADAYGELGSYAVSELKNTTVLKEQAEVFGIELKSREDTAEEAMRELLPVRSGGGKFNDTYYKLQKAYYDDIGMETISDEGFTGKGVKIAVIDSGLTPAHKDIDYSRILPGYDYDEEREMAAAADLIDTNGHGTAVTGILAAKQNNKCGIAGLLSDVSIIPLRLTPSTKSSEKEASSRKVAQAIRDAVDKYDADVITTSLDVIATDDLEAAVKYAAEKNVIVTGASGNTSNNDVSTPDDYVYPAAYDEVIGVGATDQSGAVRANSTKNDQVFVTAPGEDIALLDISMNSRAKIGSGTSYASPVIAAAAAIARQEYSSTTPDEFKELLKISINDEGSEGYDIAYGYGTIDFEALIQAIKAENNVKLDKTEIEIDVKGSEKLIADITNEWMDECGIEWTSEDESVVKVDSEGNITAVGAGTTKIIAAAAKNKSKRAECKVKVTDADAAAAAASTAAGKAEAAKSKADQSLKAAETAMKTPGDAAVKAAKKAEADAKAYAEAAKTAYEAAAKAEEAAENALKAAVTEEEKTAAGIALDTAKQNTKTAGDVLDKATSAVKETAAMVTTATKQAGKAAEAAAKKKAEQKQIANAKSAKVKIKTKALKKRRVRVTWKKSANADGYQVYQSKNNKKKFRKVATIKKAKTVKWVGKKLKPGKKYYYKVRPFKKISGKTYYGKWSNVKKIKAKR